MRSFSAHQQRLSALSSQRLSALTKNDNDNGATVAIFFKIQHCDTPNQVIKINAYANAICETK
jgi:hypothetical protein